MTPSPAPIQPVESPDPQRPVMRHSTGELDIMRAQGQAQHDAFKRAARVPIDTFTRSGFIAYFTYAGASYSISTLLCNCADVTIVLSADGTPRDYLNATYACAQHGTHQSTAIRSLVATINPRFPISRPRQARGAAWGMTGE